MTSHLAKDSRPPDSPRRRNAPAALELDRSNSTANIFLGASRKKSWMTANSDPAAPRERSSIRDSSSTASRPVSPSVSRPAESSLTAPVAAVSSSPPTRPKGMRSLSSTSQSNLASFHGNQSPTTSSHSAILAVARNAAPREISPASHTPPSLTRSPASQNQPLPGPDDARIQQQQEQQQLQDDLEQQSVSSLPSPDPTIPPRSHASPIAASERNGPSMASPSTTAFPSPPLQQIPSKHPRELSNGPALGTIPVSLSNNQQESSPQAHQINTRVGSYTPPVHSHSIPTATTQTNSPQISRQSSHTPSSSATRNQPLVTNDFFARARDQLNAFAAREKDVVGSAGSVDSARLTFLSRACLERDYIYLALHQLYCLSSCDLAWVRGLPGFSIEHEHGLVSLQRLLVSNNKISERFLIWSTEFPHPLPGLLTDRLYQGYFHKMMRLLVNFAHHWPGLETHALRVGHPPLVDDMVKSLGVVSSVLHESIHLCLSRRLLGARADSQMQEIFLQDVRYFQRSLKEPLPVGQRHRENSEIIHRYRQAVAMIDRQTTGIVAAPASAQGLPVSTQAPPASVSAPASLQITQNISRHIPFHGQMLMNTQIPTNDVASPSIRSPLVANSPRLPEQSMPNQHFAQRGVESRGLPLQTTNAMPSSTMATAPQIMAPRGLPQRTPGSHSQCIQRGPHFQHVQHVQHFQQSQQGQRLQQLQHLGSPAVPTQNLAQTNMIAVNGRAFPIVHYAPPHQPQPQLPQREQQQRLRCAAMPLLPPPNVPPVMNTRPNPNRLAIHQAHLRDPVNHFVSNGATGVEQTELLPHLTSFLLEPTILREPERSVKWDGLLSDRDMKRFPFIQSQVRGQRMHRIIKDGTNIYRLRCIKVARSTTELSQHLWAVADTVWPTAIYMHVNNEEVFPRRKLHNTRDLPLDITLYLREGENSINFHFVLGPAEREKFTYAVAVEILTFRSLAPAKALAQVLSAADSRDLICGKLARNSNDDDDELKIVSEDLKFTLIDPYTARIFNVPARGSQCEHTECFDHETYLQTRLLKTGDQSAVEADWKCPICSRDARPQNLIVDGFLVDVRKELERTNRIDGARFFKITADGNWDVTIDEEQDGPQLSRTATKRKPTPLENGPFRRPKVDHSVSIPEAAHNSASVIILD
ncbi:hypothetical protein BDV18DRAFT_133581 [Aspergillus unguis]